MNNKLDDIIKKYSPCIIPDEFAKAIAIEFSILQLESHIEHPTKPGYKRHDILNKIKELKSRL